MPSRKLLEAAASGQTSLVAEQLDNGADPNTVDQYDNPVLAIAAMHGHVDVVSALLDAGATADALDAMAAPPLFRAAQLGHKDVVARLVAGGANVNFQLASGTTALTEAAAAGRSETVQALLAANANVALHDRNGTTSLMAAAASGNVDVASQLLRAGMSARDANMEGITAMHFAAMSGRGAMMHVLASAGGDVNAASLDGTTVLRCAATGGHAAAVEALLTLGADANDGSATNVPSLVVAAGGGHLEVVDLLLQAGADINVIERRTGMTALYIAASGGHEAVVRRLVYAGAALDTAANNGLVPLTAAMANNRSAIVHLLQALRVEKRTLLHAARQGDGEGVLALLNKGLSAHEVDEYENTLVHLAVLGGHHDLLTELLARPGMPTTYINKFGESPMMLAIKMAADDMVRLLHTAQATTAPLVPRRSPPPMARLGAGGYGIVFKDTLDGVEVAVKMLKNQGLRADVFRREINVMKANPSLYVVRLVATADEDADPQLFLEFMDGGDLGSHLDAEWNQTPVAVGYSHLEVAWVVANALKDLHARGIVHRDIKTQNILLSSSHYIKVADLGIAKRVATHMTTGIGTTEWMAPKMFTSGPETYGTPVDIYAFGILLETLFPDVVEQENTAWYAALAKCCKATDPADRPTASDLVDVLRPELLAKQSELVLSLRTFRDDQLRAAPESNTLVQPQVEPEPRVAFKPQPAPRVLLDFQSPDESLSPEQHLLRAAFFGIKEVAAALFDQGVPIESASRVGQTTLLLAVAGRQPQMVVMLLARGANANAADEIGSAVHLAADTNQLDVLNALISAGAALDALDTYGSTPLHMAAMHGHLPLVIALVTAGADINLRDARGATALMRALFGSHVPTAKLLLDAGANVNDDAWGESPLFLACRLGLTSLVPQLVDLGADATALYHAGLTPLHIAIQEGHAEIVSMLLASPRGVVNQRDARGTTLLHLAVATGHVNVVDVFLNAGFDFDVTNYDGDTPWGLAQNSRNAALISLLDDAIEHKEALLEAAKHGAVDCVHMLLERPLSANVTDEVGCSLVHWAVMTHNAALLELLLKQPHLDVDTHNHEGKTPLSLAIQRGHSDIADMIFRHKQRPVDEITLNDIKDVHSHLGVGGNGSVSKGSYRGRFVAVKCPNNAAHVRSFRTEINAMLSCASPYLVELLAIADRHSESPALVLEFMDGGSLRTYLDKKLAGAPTSLNMTKLEVAWVVANALQSLHSMGFAHGDIKSLNVLVGSMGYIKVGDLGAARERATILTAVPGTLYWTAPEALRTGSSGRYGIEADVYAFGVLLTELDTLQLPYYDQPSMTSMPRAAFVNSVLDGSLRPTLRDNCEPWYRALTEQCLLADPDARPTVTEILGTLQTHVSAAVASKDAFDALHRALTNDMASVVEAQLAAGMDPNALLPGDATPLYLATMCNAKDCVQVLLASGADVDARVDGRTPLHLAASTQRYPIVDGLVRAGAAVDARTEKDGATPLLYAVINMDAVGVVQLLDADADVRISPRVGPTLLEEAESNESMAALLPLLRAASVREELLRTLDMACTNCGSRHAIKAACSACDHIPSTHDKLVVLLRRLRTLHKRGLVINWAMRCRMCNLLFDFNAVCTGCHAPSPAQSDEDDTLRLLLARLRAALNNNVARLAQESVPALPDGVHELLRVLDIGTAEERRVAAICAQAANEREHATQLVQATQEGDAVALQRLLDVSCRPNCTDENGNPLVHIAVQTRNVAVLQVLLQAPGVDLGATNSDGKTALAEALARGDMSAMRALHGALCAPVGTIASDELPTPGEAVGLRIADERYLSPAANEPVDAILSFSSPFVVPIFAQTGPDTVAVEHLDEGDLRNLLCHVPREHRFSSYELVQVQVAYCIANALADCHASGLVHGHLSSDNVFFSSQHFIKVGVPGTTPYRDGASAMLRWTAPEVLRGDARTTASDMYALGVILTELDTLELPYGNDDVDEAVLRELVLNGFRPPLSEECEENYSNIVARCVAPEPSDRMTTAELAAILQRILDAAVVRYGI
ncbi:TKL protein kinase [Saprolegnia diclina VS20]|uniref:TKL protein kinase n=1 Tax=Saprolegnia diclina (strain VS20) TaxID=1156394 RepID=T0QAY5_SAPDV|nr:TKL protein kinase [Saprolegnia diclina VS20]EQC31831.1 TKL protein kinase [Saprolegnia diclina VS20]|eukprot:XP_008614838.1 TKL protein kinase [Saprolegnia diclina VS20]